MPKDIIGARARIGTNPQLAILNLTALHMVMHDDATNPANVMLGQFTADINGPTTMNYKGRGTIAAPANVAINDRLFDYQAFEYSGGTFFNGVNIRAYVDAACARRGWSEEGCGKWSCSISGPMSRTG
jgi:hypothetical protein